MSSRSLTPPTSRRAFWPALGVFVITAAVFAPIVSHEFTWWDDHDTIHQNPHFNPPTAAGIGHYWRHAHMALYVPVTYSVWGAIAYASHGLGPETHGVELPPSAYHAASVMVHACAAVVVFLLLRCFVASAWAAIAGSLLFAAHPVQVETVAWASGMKDLLCGFFSLLALFGYACFAQRGEGARRRAWYAAGLSAFVLALLSKPTAVVVPAMAGVIDLLLVRRAFRKVMVGLAPWIVLSVVFAIIAKLVQPAAWVQPPPIWARPLIAADALAFYLYKLVLPIRLVPDYGRNPPTVLGEGWIYFTWVVPVAVAAASIIYRRRLPWLLAGGLLFVAGVAPVLGLVRFTFQTFSTVADHYLYLSMLGPALVAAFLLARRPAAGSAAAAAVVLGLLATLSVLQMRHWRDHPTLWTHTARVNPRSFAAWNNLGAWYNLIGRPDAGAAMFARALEVNPDHLDSRDNLARHYAARGEQEQVVLHLRAFIASAEKLPAESRPALSGAYQNLGRALERLGRHDEAAGAFAKSQEQ